MKNKDKIHLDKTMKVLKAVKAKLIDIIIYNNIH